MTQPDVPQVLPVLPLKDAVHLPFVASSRVVGRSASRSAVEVAVGVPGHHILVATQMEAGGDDPSRAGVHVVATRCVVHEVSCGESGLLEVSLQGVERVRLAGIEHGETGMRARWEPAPVDVGGGVALEALRREALVLAIELAGLAKPDVGPDLVKVIAHDRDLMRGVYLQAAMFAMDTPQAQALLEADSAEVALALLHEHLRAELAVAHIRQEIAERTSVSLSREQRRMVLRNQLRAIREELGGEDAEDEEQRALVERVAAADLPPAVRGEAQRDLKRLARTSPASPEHAVLQDRVELVLDLPWSARAPEAIDLSRARQVMDDDHLGLDDVKGRIVEHLAALKLNPSARAPILCFVGPPGVGKTSLGRSIARALQRPFERMSLGGLHDVAELRGHRRTYVGAMPGRVLQAIRRSRVNNPVIMLDEIDKLGRDFRGDPAAALLEVLDPEQNASFHDDYLDAPFDLSRVFFVTTANGVDGIPSPLLDRMELIALAGYSEEQKLAIARRYLVPRQLAQSGVPADGCRLGDLALAGLARRYTREAGLRQLERCIGRVVRKVAVRHAEGSCDPVEIGPDDLAGWLGPEPFFTEPARDGLEPGVAAGLAWTEAGGEVLYVECTLLPGEGGLILTGQLGPVMQESARAALSFLHARAAGLGISPALLHCGVHVHVPAGAIPKDGPSAGIAIAAALASQFTGRAVRSDTAMTGELTLTGLVLPVGGVREKVLAARRAGIHRVLVPRRNEPVLRELPQEVRDSMELVLVDRVEDALSAVIPLLSSARSRKAGSPRGRDLGHVSARGEVA